MQSQIHLKEEKGFIRDPILDTAFQDLEDLRDKLQQAQEKLFNVGVYLTVYADNEEELNQTETEIKSILESKLVYVKPSLFQQKEGLETVFPLGTDKLDVSTQLNSSPISSLFPFVSFDLSSDKGILYGINRHNNSLVLFDRFSLENYNSVIFAKAGSGKSYATKLEVLRSLMFDTEVIIIDPEREYEYLAEATGGRYFNISLNSIHHINPFDLPPVREDESPADVLRSNIIALVGLFRLMLGGLSTEEDSIMDRAITETYASKDITPETDFTGATPPTLSDLELVLAGMEGGESLAQRMAKYTKGHMVGLYQSADQCGHKQKNGGFFHQGYGRRIEADRDVSHHSLYLEYHPKGHKKKIAGHRRGLVDDEIRRHRFLLIRHRQKMQEILSGVGHYHPRCGRFLGVSLRHPDYHQLFHPAFAQTVAGNHRHRPKNFQSDRRRKVSAVGIGCGGRDIFRRTQTCRHQDSSVLHRRPNHHFRPGPVDGHQKSQRRI